MASRGNKTKLQCWQLWRNCLCEIARFRITGAEVDAYEPPVKILTSTFDRLSQVSL